MFDLKTVLESLLAELIGEENRLQAMGEYVITSSDLFRHGELRAHAKILRAVEAAESSGEKPTLANLMLLGNFNEQELALLNNLSQQRSSYVDDASLSARAYFVYNALAGLNLRSAAASIGNFANVQHSDPIHAWENMFTLLLKAAPVRSVGSGLSSLAAQYTDELRARVEARRTGEAFGAAFPFRGLRDLVPVLEDGDVTLITAPPKAGKTTAAMEIAEYNAARGIDVLWILLETSEKTIAARRLARELAWPVQAQRTGLIDPTAPPYAEQYEEYLERLRYRDANAGQIMLKYAAGQSVEEIYSIITVGARQAEARKRKLLVIIDYLQRINKGPMDGVNALNYISNRIKDAAVTNNCHIILFSQEAFNKQGQDSPAYGSNTPLMIAQIHIAIRRLPAGGQKIPVVINRTAALDALGRERYWQYGLPNEHQAVVCFQVLRANNDSPGLAFVALEAGMFRYLDLDEIAAQGGQLPALFENQKNLLIQHLTGGAS